MLRGLNEFNEGKQAIGFIATGVKRDLNESYLEDKFNKDAYSFGLDAWTNLDSAQTWVLTGWGSTTLVRGTTQRMINVQQSPLHYFQRPDADYLDVDSNATSLAGYASRIALNKQKGNWKFNSAVGIITSGFETNDLGFTFRTDQINMHLVSGYRWYDPNDFFRNMGFNIATMRNFDFDGNKFGEGYFFFYDITFLNFWSIDGNFQTSRSVLDRTYTRGGPWIRTPASYYSYINISSDSRTDLVGYLYVDGARSEGGASSYNVNPQLQWKINTNLNVSFSPSYWRNISKVGWITSLEDPTATETFNHRYVFSSLDQHEISGSIRMDWTFTPKLSLQLYLQPLISTGEYRDFKELKAPRVFDFNQYGVDNGSTISYDPSSESYSVDPDGSGPATSFSFDNPDFNYKSLRGNAVLRWEYMPGSSIYFVWTRTGDQFDNHGEFDFNHDIGDLIRMPNHDDNFLIKIAYWWNP